MPNQTYLNSQDGMRISVPAFVKQPALVRARMLNLFNQQFLTDALLREGPRADGGAVEYFESTPMYAAEASAIVEEFGEFPTTVGSLGTPKLVSTKKRGLALEISYEMRDRDNMGAVDLQMKQIRNTIVRDHESVFLSLLLNNPNVNTLAATAAWSGGTSKIRYDLAQGIYLVANSDADTTNGTGVNKFGFQPDTLVISNKTASDFLSSDDIAKVFLGGDIASENLQYTGKMPRKFFGLDVVQSWQVPANKAVVLQRKVVGGISDERPLFVSPLIDDPKRETYWSKVGRRSAMFVDQPRAACIITGV